MKTLALTLVLLCTAASSKSNTVISDKAPEFSGSILELSGNMSVNDKMVADYWIYVFENGAPKDTFFVESKKEIFIALQLNNNYAVKFVKEGFKDRILLVDTHVPDSRSSKNYSFRYLIEFLPNDAVSNTFDDFPVAYITYQKAVNDFDYDRMYHHNVRINPSAQETADL